MRPRGRAGRVPRLGSAVRPVPVGGPFPHASCHVLCSKGARCQRLGADGPDTVLEAGRARALGPWAAVRVSRGTIVSPWERATVGPARGVLPLGLGRKAPAPPRAVGTRVLPAHAVDRMSRPIREASPAGPKRVVEVVGLWRTAGLRSDARTVRVDRDLRRVDAETCDDYFAHGAFVRIAVERSHSERGSHDGHHALGALNCALSARDDGAGRAARAPHARALLPPLPRPTAPEPVVGAGSSRAAGRAWRPLLRRDRSEQQCGSAQGERPSHRKRSTLLLHCVWQK